MRLPHNIIRDWWHRPVLDRLDRIAENTQPATVPVDPRLVEKLNRELVAERFAEHQRRGGRP